MCVCYPSSDDSHWSKLWLGIKWREGIEQYFIYSQFLSEIQPFPV